jgi:hypothetical protein
MGAVGTTEAADAVSGWDAAKNGLVTFNDIGQLADLFEVLLLHMG